MAQDCLNKDFLREIIGESISCSSPQKARWKGSSSQHCGYCIPCIIRRAAIYEAFKNDSTSYLINDVSELISNHAKEVGFSLRSFQIAIKRIKEQPQLARYLIHKSGSLLKDDKYLKELSGVYQRGLLEVDDFIANST
jgi:hypothetical protein